MASSTVLRLVQLQQQLNELEQLSNPTMEDLERLQEIASEIELIGSVQHSAPPPPPPPPPPVYAGVRGVFPVYGGPVPCTCGACEQCCVAPGNPLSPIFFQGPNGCAPAFTLQGPPGLVGATGPTGATGPKGDPGSGNIIFDSACGVNVDLIEPPNPAVDYVVIHTDGPIARDVPDDQVTGGNCRGMYSMDWQALRTSATQVAAGTGSVISGGLNNQVDSYYGEIVGGNGNLIGDDYFNITSATIANIGGIYNPVFPLDYNFSPFKNSGSNTNPQLSSLESFYKSIPAFAIPGSFIAGGMNNSIQSCPIAINLFSLTTTTLSEGLRMSRRHHQRQRDITQNALYGSQNLIGVGVNNSITGAYCTIENGIQNTITSDVITLETRSQDSVFVFTGTNNSIHNGYVNTIDRSGFSTILNGVNNSMTGGSYSQILSGYNNNVVNYSNNNVSFDTIINGQNNRISDTFLDLEGNNTIINGKQNIIQDSDDSCVYGVQNLILESKRCGILGGQNNLIFDITNAVTVGGDHLLLNTVNESCAVGRYNLDGAFKAQKYIYIDSNGGVAVGEEQTFSNRLFMVGNGNDTLPLPGGRRNAFSVLENGIACAQLGFSAQGADYAEYFEAAPEDVMSLPIGTPVTINPETGFIKAAQDGDQFLGVIRSKKMQSCLIGNAYNDHWHGIYVKDEHDDIVYTTTDVVGENGKTTKKHAPVVNPAYDPSKTYVPRASRLEWFVVGLMGQILILKGRPTSPRWIRMKSHNHLYDKWYVCP